MVVVVVVVNKLSFDLEKFHLEDRPSCLDDHGPIFILGCPRSGTTFLSECMSGIPGICEFVGLLAPPRLMHVLGRNKGVFGSSEILDVVRDIFWQHFWRGIYTKGDRVKRWLQGKIGLFEMFATPNLEGKFFCYKEPFLCFAVDPFAISFPKSKFIHIIRDGRDNADSMARTYPYALSDEVLTSDFYSLNKNSEIGFWIKEDGFNFPWWVPKNEWAKFREMSKYQRCVRLWVEMTARARSLRETLPPDRYLEIRYEDFVSKPFEIGKKILDFLGSNDSPKFNKNIGKANINSVNIAMKNQGKSEIAKANEIAGELLLKLGYKL